MDVSERLERYRVERDITYERLAVLLGFSVRTVYKWCKGTRNPNARNMHKIEKRLPGFREMDEPKEMTA